MKAMKGGGLWGKAACLCRPMRCMNTADSRKWSDAPGSVQAHQGAGQCMWVMRLRDRSNTPACMHHDE